MCGIFLALTKVSSALEFVKLIENHFSNNVHCQAGDNCIKSCLLRRGPDSATQYVDYQNNFFSFASILWHQGLLPFKQPVIDSDRVFLWNGDLYNLDEELSMSDTEFMFSAIKRASESDYITLFGNLTGPWSFILVNMTTKKLWFGRDMLGRRSLLIDYHNDHLILSSIAIDSNCVKYDMYKPDFFEVPANGIFSYDIECCTLTQHKWDGSHIPIEKVTDITHVHPDLPPNFQINCSVPTFNLDEFNVMSLNELCNHSVASKYCDILIDKLGQAVEKRVKLLNNCCSICITLKLKDDMIKCNHSKVGVLFSGGLDSTVLAYLLHQHLPVAETIDLLNVAFSNNSNFETPDRITGLSSLENLKSVCPNRTFNFVKINVSTSELSELREKRISQLLQPCGTVLDDSIGSALWFASRGLGILHEQKYQSPIRVLLLGMGADELLAGYSRHRQVFMLTGWTGLINELELEMQRISSRNLGRDNRIVADNGREARYPYLDEDVVQFLLRLPVWVKANLNLPRGTGEKLLLRLVALKCGLTYSSSLPKRAIQFGSRIAKLENRKEKGSDKCHRLVQE